MDSATALAAPLATTRTFGGLREQTHSISLAPAAHVSLSAFVSPSPFNPYAVDGRDNAVAADLAG